MKFTQSSLNDLPIKIFGGKSHFVEEDISGSRRGICLHFTAGRFNSDFKELTKSLKSVPYLIREDGDIYQLHDPKYWAYHLGPGCVGRNKSMSIRYIGIELSNMGPLDARGMDLYDWTSRKFCRLDEREKYIAKNWRGKRYWAAFHKAQVEACAKLCERLCEKYSIPKRIMLSQETQTGGTMQKFSGIATHTNFRKDKYDIGPAFEIEVFRNFGFDFE